MSSKQLIWFITGCSSGIGRELALAVLARGDKVIATTRARSFASILDLKDAGAAVLQLDVTAPVAEINQIAEEAIKIYGHVDVVINNAGYVLSGALEEVTHDSMVTLFHTNVFGAMNVSRAFLPHMRERKTGTVAFIGSVWGWSTSPFAGAYVATKFALRGMSNTLADEIAPFGLRSICFDFGYFRTAVFDKVLHVELSIEDYKKREEEFNNGITSVSGHQRGDTIKGVNIMIDVVKGEGVAKDKKPPVGLAVGVDCFDTVKRLCEKALEDLEEWKDVSCSTDYQN